jgi:hypothetical protein
MEAKERAARIAGMRKYNLAFWGVVAVALVLSFNEWPWRANDRRFYVAAIVLGFITAQVLARVVRRKS